MCFSVVNFTTFWKQILKVTAGRNDHDMVVFDPLVHPERKRLQKRKVHLCTEAHVPTSRFHRRKMSDWSTRDKVTLPNSKWHQYVHGLFIPVERRLIAV